MSYMKLSAMFLSLLALTPCTSCKKNHISKSSATDWRLPDTIRPLSYRIHINVTEGALTDDGNKFHGMVVIEIMATNTTKTIKLHASHKYLKLNLITFNNKDVDEADYSVNYKTDILTIKLRSQLPPNILKKLIIDFTGNISTDLRGFYKTNYDTTEGSTRYLVVTQMEPTYARRVFPCFDEPSFKATFEIYITYPIGYNALSNMPGSLYMNNSKSETMRFEKTTVMTIYLVAFIVSDLTCSQGESVGSVAIRVCSRPETSNMREWALEVAPKILRYMDEYTQYSYNRSMPKVDHIAVPKFEEGAMENWGLVLYSEELLLWDPNENSEQDKESVAITVAHEISHFWFGNLVTCNWWSEIFLNEAFASYFEYFAAHGALPSWELDKLFRARRVYEALQLEGISIQPSIQLEANTPEEIKAKFDIMTYSKGSAVVSMVKNMIGHEQFKEGLRNYFHTFKYWNALPDDLWEQFQEVMDNTTLKLPASNLNEIMYNWINKPGFPLINVRTFDSHVEITQEGFLMGPKNKNVKWYVPMCYSTSEHKEKFVCKGPNVWLTPTSTVNLKMPKNNYKWFLINNILGHFRVNYDTIGWNNIRDALQNQEIPEMNRAQIVDDLFSLAISDRMPYSRVFDIIQFLANDTSYYTWLYTSKGFDYVMHKVGTKSELGQIMSAYYVKLLDNVYKNLSFTTIKDDHVYTLKQQHIFRAACKYGHANCILLSSVFFTINKLYGLEPNKHIRQSVICYALKHSEDETDWEFAWKTYLNNTNNLWILTALGCSQNRNLLERYLNSTLAANSSMKAQDKVHVFKVVCVNGPVGAEVAFEFMQKNIDRIKKLYEPDDIINMIKYLCSTITTTQRFEQFKQFVQTGSLPKETTQLALHSYKLTAHWQKKYKPDLLNYFKKSNNFSAVSAADTLCFLLYYVLLSSLCYFI